MSAIIWMFQFQTGAIRSEKGNSYVETVSYKFRFQTGAIRRRISVQLPQELINGFDSKLVRLEVKIRNTILKIMESFDSKLVRLEGFPKTTLILYCTLTVPVKLIFIFSRLKGNLLSTSNRANSLGG